MKEKTTNLKKARRNPEKELPEVFQRFLMRTHNTSRFMRALKSKKAQFRDNMEAVAAGGLLAFAFDWDATKEGEDYWKKLHLIWKNYFRICKNGIVIKDN